MLTYIVLNGLFTMVELIRNVRKYGSGRRHIEVPIDYFDDLPVGEKVVIVDKASFDRLKKNQKNQEN